MVFGAGAAIAASVSATAPVSSVSLAQLAPLLQAQPAGVPAGLTAAQVQTLLGQAPTTVGQAEQVASLIKSIAPVGTAASAGPFAIGPATAPATAGAASPSVAATTLYYYGLTNTEQFGVSALGITAKAAYISAGVSGFTTYNNDYLASKGNIILADGPEKPVICMTDGKHYYGGEDFYGNTNHPTWYHILHIVTIGEGVNGACVGINTQSASFRFASNAYYDCYNDFGFGPAVNRCGTLSTNKGPY
jgi:hypothetical protein